MLGEETELVALVSREVGTFGRARRFEVMALPALCLPEEFAMRVVKIHHARRQTLIRD